MNTRENTGDLELAKVQWERLNPFLSEDMKRHASFGVFSSLAGNSRFLIDFILKTEDPTETISRTLHSLGPKPFDVMARELDQAYLKFDGSLASIQSLLRRYKYQEYLRIAARDLSAGCPYEETGHELAQLASLSCETALKAARVIIQDGHPEPFVVLGMGKLGGDDLNFSSDIDLIYVHNAANGANTAHAQDALRRHTLLSETLTRILQECTEEGFVFRVDLDLRPEGKSGVLVNSLEALTGYYEISGAPWERGALIKARPVAGDFELGEDILRQVEPFVYPKHTDTSSIRHLKEMKQKIDRELIQKKQKGYHVKLGPGGIREIEFFTHAFQLIYGGKVPALRERNTLKVLDLLENLKMAPAEDIRGLSEAYRFLRRIENRLQMEEERQTHTLPLDAVSLESMARRMALKDGAELETLLKRHTDFVTACFERLVA